MTQIQPVVFPLNLGTANCFIMNISANNSIPGGVLTYNLLDNSSNPPARLAQGIFQLTEEQFLAHGSDKTWVINYIAEQLGVTIVTE